MKILLSILADLGHGHDLPVRKNISSFFLVYEHRDEKKFCHITKISITIITRNRIDYTKNRTYAGEIFL